MEPYRFCLGDTPLAAWPDRALSFVDCGTLVVADLHLGRAERLARRGGGLLPPYETAETLARLAAVMDRLDPPRVVCLGDSFDDDAAEDALDAPARARLLSLMAGRDWIWIAGNHDPGPRSLPGLCRAEWAIGAIRLRHRPASCPDGLEIASHYHPKAWLPAGARRAGRPCFAIDARRVILPAFGAFTGGMACDRPPIRDLMGPGGVAVLTGLRRALVVPLAPVQLARPGRRATTGAGLS